MRDAARGAGGRVIGKAGGVKTLAKLAETVAAQRQRLTALLRRPGGVERVYRLRAVARLEAADMAVAVAQAMPSADLVREAESAVRLAGWGIGDVGEMRHPARIRSAEELLTELRLEGVA